jgi:hypothetical protein
MSKPTVFISYSHLDEEWKDRLVRHLAVSQKQGHLELWHDRMIGAGEDWEWRIQTAMNAASVAILLVSADSLTSDFILREEVTRLLERRASEGLRIFPVVIKPCDWGAVDWLRRMNPRPKDGKPLSGGSDHEIDLAFTEIAKDIRELLKRTAPPVTPTFVSLDPDEISTSRLPRLLTPDLFGRERELQMLDDAWANLQTNVISFVAWGGVGKMDCVKPDDKIISLAACWHAQSGHGWRRIMNRRTAIALKRRLGNEAAACSAVLLRRKDELDQSVCDPLPAVARLQLRTAAYHGFIAAPNLFFMLFYVVVNRVQLREVQDGQLFQDVLFAPIGFDVIHHRIDRDAGSGHVWAARSLFDQWNNGCHCARNLPP